MTKPEQSPPDAERVKFLFDQLSLAIYCGMAMRGVLKDNPKAHAAAETLVKELREAQVPGMDPDPA
jgi:hypothetical protein